MTARRPRLAAVAAEHADEPDAQQVVIALGDLRGLLAIHNGVLAELSQLRAQLDAVREFIADAKGRTEYSAAAAAAVLEGDIDAAAARYQNGGNDHA